MWSSCVIWTLNYKKYINLLFDEFFRIQFYTFGTETTGSGDSVQVGVGVFGHVVVENNVDPLNVHTATKQVGGY